MGYKHTVHLIYIFSRLYLGWSGGGFFIQRRSQSTYSRFKIHVVLFSLLQNRNIKGASVAAQFVLDCNAALNI